MIMDREETEKMAEVWRLNYLRNQLIEGNKRAIEERKKYSTGLHPRVKALMDAKEK